MDKDTKNKVTDAIKDGVEAGKAAAEATKSKPWPAWLRWAVIIGAVIAASVGSLAQTSCTQLQVKLTGEVIHDAYHIAHPEKDCILRVEADSDK